MTVNFTLMFEIQKIFNALLSKSFVNARFKGTQI